MWRRLDELVVPVAAYDAACPRWHTPTLSERLDDLLAVRAQDFPRGWRTWAQTGWAGIKEGLASARATLGAGSAKTALLTEAVDADLRAGLTVDVALPSRTGRDAFTWHLAGAGVPLPADGQLVIRSLADAGAWQPPRATVLAAPPARLLRHRITSADIGPLSVLCYDHEVEPLRRMLCDALDEPAAVGGPVHQLLPPALQGAGRPARATARRRALGRALRTGPGPARWQEPGAPRRRRGHRRPYRAERTRAGARPGSAGRRATPFHPHPALPVGPVRMALPRRCP